VPTITGTVPARFDFAIAPGARYRQSFQYVTSAGVPISILGWTARMQVRQPHDSDVILLENTVANGRLIISTGTDGIVEVYVPANVTSTLAWGGRAWYDLELVPPGGQATTDVVRLAEGYVTLKPEATR
jgi:hypothetical protein